MTAKWQGGHTYTPGSFVTPVSGELSVPSEVANGDFSSGDLTHWTANPDTYWTVLGTGGYNGEYCVQSIAHDSSNPPASPNIQNLTNDTLFPVSPGDRFSCSAMYKPTHSHDSTNKGWITIAWLDAGGSEISYIAGGVYASHGGAWHQVTAEGHAPANAKHAVVRLQTNGNYDGYSLFSHVTVDYGYVAPPPGLMYKAVQAAPAKSGSTEPNWPTVVGQTVQDGGVTWEAVTGSRIVWQASPILKSGDTEPTWPSEEGGVVRDGTINWTAHTRQITDTHCPASKLVVIAAGKVYAGDDDIIRYCATVNPLDWTSQDDAGYLPFGLQTYGANPVAAMGLYRSNLVAFNAEGFQLWQVDENPANSQLVDALPIASTHNHALAPVANDLLFLCAEGVRSIGIAASAVNLKAGDVGMPIDALVVAALKAATKAPRATYVPGLGQYWIAFSGADPITLPDALPVQDFEADLTPFTGTWARSTDAPIAGTYSLRSQTGSISSSSTQISLPADAHARRLSFDWDASQTSALNDTDAFDVTVNGVNVFHNAVPGSGHVDVAIADAGTVDIVFRYWKTGTYILSTDNVAIDNVRVYHDVIPGGPSTTFVYTMNRAGQAGTWSEYTFPFPIDAFAQLGDTLYIRSGDDLLKLDETVMQDYAGDARAVDVVGTVQWPWLDLKMPGQTKQLIGLDVVGTGSAEVSVGYDQTNPATFTTPFTIPADTVPGQLIPLPVMAPSLSVKLTWPGGQKWQLQAVTLYLQDQRSGK